MTARKPTRKSAGGRAQDASEATFLATYDPSVYERPSVAVDVAVVSVMQGALQTLLVQRTEHPYKGKWALPGGFPQLDESLDDAAARVLDTKAHLRGLYLEQLYTFGDVKRDPRTRVISVAYYALVNSARFDKARNSGHADTVIATVQVPWQGEVGGAVQLLNPDGNVLPMAFDHDDILGLAVKRMRGKLDYAPIGFELLSETFTLLELQKVHESILGRPQNKDSFRRRMLSTGLLQATGKMQSAVEHRPAELYRFGRATNRTLTAQE